MSIQSSGVTVANSGFRSVIAEHPIYTAACNIICPVSVSAISLPSEDVKSGTVTAVSVGGGGGLSDVSPMQKVVAEFDEWEMAGGEEEMMVSVGEMLSRFVFGGALVYLSGSTNEDGGFCISGSSSSPYSKACVVNETVVTKSVPKHAMQAFRFLNETRAVQSIVASIACDLNMWNCLSDFFNNLFGGNKVFFNADGNTKLGTVEMTLGASFMGLAVMVRMVIVSKRGQS
ncbi:putative beta-glucosidase 41-like [Capsicum annuum]|nr:putative beta-glucosidase 41-like [Capsicum annuum]